MTEEEFFQEYRNKLVEFSDKYKLEISDYNENNLLNFIKRCDWIKQQIILKSNELISEILLENNISPFFKVVQTTKSGSAIVDLVRYLTFKSSTINLEIIQDFDSHLRDFSNSYFGITENLDFH